MKSSQKNKPNLYLVGLVVCTTLFVGCRQQDTIEPETISDELRNSVTPLEKRSYETITVGDQDLTVEVVNTPSKTELGLSYRDEIGADGMLFELPQKQVPTFWMKGMLFDLDLVWIDCESSSGSARSNEEQDTSDKFVRDELIGKSVFVEDQECKVVDVTRNAPAPAEPLNLPSLPTYSPQFPVTHVLETVSAAL